MYEIKLFFKAEENGLLNFYKNNLLLFFFQDF